MKIVAGDIGGTKTLLRLADAAAGLGPERVLREQRFENKHFANLESVVNEFLASAGLRGADAACFAVAGPIGRDGDADTAQLPNLPWAALHSTQLAQRCNVRRVRLINDFHGVALGIGVLPPSDLAPIQAGRRDPSGPVVILGAGTGLGVCQILRVGGEEVVVPSEGGHGDFAPRDEREVELWRYLAARHGHVSWERVVSGPGLAAIFRFLADTLGVAQRNAVREVLEASDLAAAVTAAAGHLDIAAEAVEMFVSIYGAVAGNFALLNLPYGGVYLAGGIGPRIIAHLQSGKFIEAFHAKGRMNNLMQGFPVHVAMNPAVGLLGAERVALRIAAGST